MIRYVLGFAFDDLGRVALIRKNKPDWQRGKWNGIGGKIEEGEMPHMAMFREFAEETGVFLAPDLWQGRGVMDGPGFSVTVFRIKHVDVRLVRTMEEEVVLLWTAGNVDKLTCIDNVPALIALCQLDEVPFFCLNYNDKTARW